MCVPQRIVIQYNISSLPTVIEVLNRVISTTKIQKEKPMHIELKKPK